MKPLMWAAIAVLGAFYALLAWGVLHPKVSDVYRAYYMTKTSGLSPSERKIMRPVQARHVYSSSDVEIGFDSWDRPRDGERWSATQSAKIVFIVEGDASALTAIDLNLAAHHADRIEWRLNGGEMHTSAIGDRSTLSLDIKPGQLKAGDNMLEVRLPQWRRTFIGDPNRAAVGLVSFSIH